MNTNEFVVARGQNVHVVATGYRTTNPYLDFLQNLNAKEKKKTEYLLKYVSDKHPIGNTEKYKKVESDLFELKPDKQLRIFCFSRKTKLVLANGYRKKGNKLNKNQIKKAREIRRFYDGG